MRTIVPVILFLLILVPVSLGWELNEFMIFTYGVNLTEENVRTLARADFNTVYGPVEKLELCRSYGLKLMIPHPGTETASTLFGDPAVWGYDVMDEPISLEQLYSCADSVKAYHEADPTHPGFVNLNQKGGDWIRMLIDIVEPDVLGYDDYQWWYGGVYEWFTGTPVHFVKLEQHRDAALEAGIPLIAWREVNVQRNVSGQDRRNFATPSDNAQKIRQSIYTSLVYGVKGILWFTGYLLFDEESSVLNKTGKQVAAINAELKRLAPILIHLRSTGVFHTPPVPRGSRQTTPDNWVQPLGDNLLMGTFRDDAKRDYLIVVNKDWRHERKAVLQFQLFQRKIQSVEMFNKKSGGWSALTVRTHEDDRDHEYIYNFENIPQRIKDYITYNHEKLDAKNLSFFELYHTYPPPYDTVEFILPPGDGELLRVVLEDGENIPDPRKQ